MYNPDDSSCSLFSGTEFNNIGYGNKVSICRKNCAVGEPSLLAPCNSQGPTNCVLGPWSDAQPCQGPCGGAAGTKQQNTLVLTPAANGGTCPPWTDPTRTRVVSCITPACSAINCTLSDWTNSGSCSVKACGTTGGTQTQTRTVTTPASNGGTCNDPLTRTISCNAPDCPVATVAGQHTLFNDFTFAPTSVLGPDGQTPWIWCNGGTPQYMSSWTSASPPNPWPTYNSGAGGTQQFLIKSPSSSWILSYLSTAAQLCMWNLQGGTWTPIWWTTASVPGSITSLPTFSSSGLVTQVAPGGASMPWGFCANSGTGPFTLSVNDNGQVLLNNGSLSWKYPWPSADNSAITRAGIKARGGPDVQPASGGLYVAGNCTGCECSR